MTNTKSLPEVEKSLVYPFFKHMVSVDTLKGKKKKDNEYLQVCCDM